MVTRFKDNTLDRAKHCDAAALLLRAINYLIALNSNSAFIHRALAAKQCMNFMQVA